MKARVHIFYKDSVFDPQGNTVAHSLRDFGFEEVENVRVGKVIDLQLTESDENLAQQQVEKMCQQLLANPVIEAYQFELIN